MLASSTEIVKPPLKWAGGKRWLVPTLRPLWEPFRNRRYVEPFCGGLAAALGLQPEQALLNDVNPHLINFYRQLQAGLKIDFVMQNDRSAYDSARTRFNMLIADENYATPEAAGLFYYLNRTGFNGLCRFNRRGEFNVPFGRYTTINYTRDFTVYQSVMKNWHFTLGDFMALDLSETDFIYADPPYDVEFVSYSKEGFTWDDQVRVAEWLANRPNPVVVSNQATERIIKLYERLGFAVLTMEAPRRISSSGDRTPALEVLAAKNLG